MHPAVGDAARQAWLWKLQPRVVRGNCARWVNTWLWEVFSVLSVMLKS